jgi:gamma-glutamyltranspeptidase/glutathione hydrolase
VVAAGHPLTAEAGARVLREGGNAVDAAVAAMLTSWVAESLLTGPGAGGYLLVAGAGREPALLDFFVAAPGCGAEPDAGADAAPLVPVTVSFGDTVQVFHVGAASCGTYGTPAGIEQALRRWGTVPLADLAAPAAALARRGVRLNAQQAYLVEILAGILLSTPEAAALLAPDQRLLGEGDVLRSPELADTITRLGSEGSAPFYTGDLARAVLEWVGAHGGRLTRLDLSGYEAVARAPVAVAYRGRDVFTNPPPSAGGVLLALALGRLAARPSPPTTDAVVAAMDEAQSQRTAAFVDDLHGAGFADAFLASRLGSTTHISVIDGSGQACSVTCTNGEGSGIVVPGTGIHLNNVMGEEDLNPFGFHRVPAGRRMPSMMAPTIVSRAGDVELALGSAGSNRIRSAILQTIVGVVDHGLDAAAAVDAPRLHSEAGVVYAEPGVDVSGLAAAGRPVVAFRAQNLFFGGVQAARRDPATGALDGAGDRRRGGAAVHS